MADAVQTSSASTRCVKRSSVACTPCRYKHLKCDGHKPSCARCLSDDKQCLYPQSRRKGNVRQNVSQNLGSEDIFDHMIQNHSNLPDTSSSVSTLSSRDRDHRLAADEMANSQTSKSSLMDLYFEFFHSAHPCVLPKHSLRRYLSDDRTRLLVQVICYIGSLFSTLAPSETHQELLKSTLNDVRFGKRATHAFDVQAVLLYSIAIYWRHEPHEGATLLEESIGMASRLGMHHRNFAALHSQGDATLEESWRRTWWQIFIADVHLAGSAHDMAFRTGNIDMTVDLPCEESDYEAGTIPPPQSLEDYDMREFLPCDEPRFSSFAELIGLTRGLFLALSCESSDDPKKHASICAKADTSMIGWDSLLPPTKRCLVRPNGSLDEMMFKAQFIRHTCTVEFHRRLSTLAASPIEFISRCAPLAPDDRFEQYNPSETHVHTVKCLKAIKEIDDLLALPTGTTVHSPFLICMVANVTIAHLSACRYIFRGRELAQCREKIRLTLGTLKTLSHYWLLGKRTHEEIGLIANDCLFPTSDTSSTANGATPIVSSTIAPTQWQTDGQQDQFIDIGSLPSDDFSLTFLESLQEPVLGI